MAKKRRISERRNQAGGGRFFLPSGVTLERTIEVSGFIRQLVWSPGGKMLATLSREGAIELWNPENGDFIRRFNVATSSIRCISFDPKGRTLAESHGANTITLWDLSTGQVVGGFEWPHRVNCITFDQIGKNLAVGSEDGTVGILTKDGKTSWKVQSAGRVNVLKFDPLNRFLAAHSPNQISIFDVKTGKFLRALSDQEWPRGLAFDPTGTMLVTAGDEGVVRVWNAAEGRLLRTLEGHTSIVDWVDFSPDGQLMASKSNDETIRLWYTDTFQTAAIIGEPKSQEQWIPALAFHPSLPMIATVGSGRQPNQDIVEFIHLLTFDLAVLRNEHSGERTTHYVNAKVILLGDTGVGKSGLSLVLNHQPFSATDSTPGRKVWTFESTQVQLEHGLTQTRETLLWDLAGQPGYRVIHQLHLNEVAVALVVFDARSETDPLAGVRHWERALRLAQQRQGPSAVPLKKFLVSARSDRGTVSVSKERLAALLREFGFDGYFETSAKEGWKIRELEQTIKESIAWKALPEVSSSVLFADIKSFLLDAKKTGRLVARANQLYDDFARVHPDEVAKESNLRHQFDTCIGRLENRDLIRRLSFGGYVLLQPELLDAYASAMVNAAKKEPDGLGSIAEDVALNGQFYVPEEQKLGDRGQEQLILHATVEELVRHDLALRESATDGRYLVFPSEFIRDYEAAPEPKGKALAITFAGPVQSLYSTLAVRLGHSGLFTTGRAEMWRNAALFTAKAGGKCGLYLHEFEEARGRLIIFYDEKEGVPPTQETRFHFEEFVLAHAQRHALAGTIRLVRFFVCSNGHPVPDDYVKLLTEQAKKVFECPCGMSVSLAEPKERIHFDSQVAAMDRSADRQRAFEVFVESARGETSTPGFTEWAGDDRVTLAIIFTDVVGSTALGQRLGDARMEELRKAHFDQSRKLINQYKGREIKTIGDSFMAAFKSVGKALDYAMALQKEPGDSQIRLRAGIHIGAMTVEENDVFGGTVNFAARVVGAIRDPEIWLSERAKEDLDGGGAKQHAQLRWQRKDGVEMKGFNGTFSLWSLEQ